MGKLRLLSQKEANILLKKYKLPIVDSKICKDEKELIQFSKKRYPVVIKIDSPDIIHKSDAKAVFTNIENEQELKKTYKQLIKNVKAYKSNAKINGVLVQKQISGHNLIIGMKKDPTFGPVIIFGLGGILVEILKDVSKRIAPITQSDATEMIKEIRSYKIIEGYRGEQGGNIPSLKQILLNLSKLCTHEKNIEEIDFNPVITNKKESLIVDTRIMIKDD